MGLKARVIATGEIVEVIAIDGDTAYPLQIQKRSDGKWCVGYQGWYDCVGDLYDSVIWIYQLLIGLFR